MASTGPSISRRFTSLRQALQHTLLSVITQKVMAQDLAIDCTMAFWVKGYQESARRTAQFLINDLLFLSNANPRAEQEVIKRFQNYQQCLHADGLWSRLKQKNPILANSWLTWLKANKLPHIVALIN